MRRWQYASQAGLWLWPLLLVQGCVGLGRAQELTLPRPATPQAPLLVPPPAPRAGSTMPAALGLPDLLRLSLEQNPTLIQAGFEIDAAQGRAVQAGLYPNPTVSLTGDEIGKNGGIHTLPQITQEIVTGKKLVLSRAATQGGVDQAHLALMRQRYALFTTVRQGYFEVLADQRRIEVLTELVKLATQAHDTARRLLEAKQIAELDFLPFQVELNRLRGDLDAARRELEAAWQRLVASMGVPQLPLTRLLGALDAALPNYDFERAKAFILEAHPEVRSAQVGITRAQLTLQREQAQVIPNVTLTAGYSRNFNDRENQAMYGVSIPVPVFNRNQGNIRAAQAELGVAAQEVYRVRYDLTNRLAAAFGRYATARERAERYRTAILPDTNRAYQFALAAFKGGQFEYLRVVQAQRAAAEANLEYLRILADAWRAASEIAGLLLEEDWPCPPAGPGAPTTK